MVVKTKECINQKTLVVNNSFLKKNTLGILILLLVIPMVVTIGMAFFSGDAASNQSAFSLLGFVELLTPLRLNELLKIASRALIICLCATIISFLISYLLIIYTSKKFQLLFLVLITLPFLANESVRVFSWQYVLSENGFFNKILSSLAGHSIIVFDGSNSINVYVVMIISCIPFGIFINSASLGTIPNIYWKASNDLNLNSLNRFFKIALPLSKFALLASVLVIFFISFSLSSEVNFLGGDSKISTRNLILSLMSASRFQSIFSLGFVMILILIAFAMLYKLFNRFKQ